MTYVYLMLCPHCRSVRGIESSIDLNSLESGDLNRVYCSSCAGGVRRPMKMLRERPPSSVKYACYILKDE